MTKITYDLNCSLLRTLQIISEIENEIGMVPSVITSGYGKYRYNAEDARKVIIREMSEEYYCQKNEII